MAKVLIGADLGSYSFNKTAKTITFSGFKPILEEILLITDVTNGTIIYQFNDLTKGGTLSGQVLTLTYDTTGASFNNTDSLQIFYWSEQPQAVSIQDMSILFRHLIEAVQNPSYYNKAKNRVDVNLPPETSISSVNSVEIISKLNYLGNNISASTLVTSELFTSWALTVRSKIT